MRKLVLVVAFAAALARRLAERDYQQFLIEAGFEPTIDSNSEKFRPSLEGNIAQ